MPKRSRRTSGGHASNASTVEQPPTPSLPSAITTKPSNTLAPSLTSTVPAIPRWKRAADSKMRKKVARILVLKMTGKRTSEIAKKLDTTPDTIRHYLYIAGKNGWLSPDGMELVDPAEQLVYEAGHKIARNVSQALDGKALASQQFEMTVEAAKGLGYFKNHSAAKVEGQIQMPALEVRFEMPKFANPTAPTPDTLGGAPAYVEGQVVGPSALTEGDDGSN